MICDEEDTDGRARATADESQILPYIQKHATQLVIFDETLLTSFWHFYIPIPRH